MTDGAPVPDYSDYVEAPATTGDLGVLSNLAEQQRHWEEEVERIQLLLKNAQAALKDVAEHKLPEAMEQVGMEKFSTQSGLTISIRETIRASLGTGPAKEANLDWLTEQGHEAIIKLGVEIPFGRGEDQQEQAKALAARLRDEGVPASYMRKVEPSTLSALIRELLEQGADVPEERFGVFRQRVAKVSV